MDDLSLSQSLGGLRIANRTDGDEARTPPTPAAAAAAATSRKHTSPTFDADGRLDIASSLGFDPLSYTAHHQATPPPQLTTAPARPNDRGYFAPKPSGSSWRHQLDQTTTQRTRGNSAGEQRAVSSSSSAAGAAAIAAMGASATQRSPSSASSQFAPQHPPRRSSKPHHPGRQDSYGNNSTNYPAELAYAAEATPVATPGTPLSGAEEQRDGPMTHKDRSLTTPAVARDLAPARDLPAAAPTGTSTSTSRRGGDREGRQPKPVKKGVKDFAFGRTLGEGSYSTVLSATDRSTAREFAIKVLDKRHIIKEKKVKYVNIEKDTLNRLTDHPGIVRLYYTFQDERSLYFVLDLATGGELLGVLKKTGSFDEDCTRFYAGEILDSIEYMHSRGIIHRDLKPENVLLDDQMHVKITDFGTAKILDISKDHGQAFGKVSVTNDPMDGADQDRAMSFVGTAEYVSPELLTDKNACKASDLWAFGCIVYQLLAGRPPFKASNEYQTFQKIVNLEYHFPDNFPPLARDLIERLLVLNPAERLSISGIKNHRFFEGVEWGKGMWKLKPPKLRPYRPLQARLEARQRKFSNGQPRGGIDDSAPPAIPKRDHQLQRPPHSSAGHTSAHDSSHGHGRGHGPGHSSSNSAGRVMPKIVTEVAPPSQLDIDWANVLNKTNERILKCENLVVYSAPAPAGPIARSASDNLHEAPSKFSRFFGTSAVKKRQRLVMVTSGGRIVLAPSGGDKKEAKLKIELNDPDVSFKSQQDAKGYTVWCVMTRERTLTFEDPKANTGDSGSSARATKEWVDILESARDYAASQTLATTYVSEPAFAVHSPGSTQSNLETTSLPPPPDMPQTSIGWHRHTLRKPPATSSGSPGGGGAGPDDDAFKGRKRFSKRHSKTGLAAVF